MKKQSNRRPVTSKGNTPERRTPERKHVKVKDKTVTQNRKMTNKKSSLKKNTRNELEKRKKQKIKAVNKKRSNKPVQQNIKKSNVNPVNDRRKKVNRQLGKAPQKAYRKKVSGKIKPRNRMKAKITPGVRKVRVTVLYVSVILILFIGLSAFLGMVMFRINNINILGESRYQEEEIRDSIGVNIGDNLILCDTSKVKNDIERNLPYTEIVYIKKNLPETLIIEINEAKIYTNIQTDNGFIYLDEKSRILGKGKQPESGAMILKGVKLKSEEVSTTAEFSDSSINSIFNEFKLCFDEYGLNNITEVDISDKLNCKVLYDNRITIEFGQPTDLNYKVKMAIGVLSSESITESSKGVLDASLAASENRTYFKPTYGSS